MPNKKASRNAYFFFVLDMIPELRRRGYQVTGVKEAIPLCSGDWALLSAEEKTKYAEKAKEWKNREPEPPRHGGGVLSPYEEQEQMSDAQAGGDLSEHDWLHKKHEDLDKCVIYILNVFSHGEMPSMCEQRFVPCEISCVRYSLQDGILDSFHDFIDPGELPLGFRYHCQAGSAATHQIPVSGFELANRDYHNLFHSLCDFVRPAPKCWTSVYCKSNDLRRVRWCLQWLAIKAGMENNFELRDVETLIVRFYRNKLDEEPSKSSVHRLLDVVQWDYADNTRCKWHEENDMWYCALASCKKVTYCISRALASVYDVVLTAAHLPNLQANAKKTDSNTVVLHANRYQKKTTPQHLAENETPNGAVRGESSLRMRGVGTLPISKVRGRGILRFLEDSSPAFATSG